MRTLVQNYSSEISTEPMYIAQGLKNLGFEAELWDQNQVSAFDIFDDYKPDIFITHSALITEDTVKRLDGTDIKVMVNVTGMQEGVIPRLEELFPGCNLFQNETTIKNVDTVPACADIFLPAKNVLKYKIDLLCLVRNGEEIEKFNKMDKSDYRTYHVVGVGNSLRDLKGVDAALSLRELPIIYPNYSNRIACGVGQAAYDAAYHGGECGILSNSKTISMFLKKESVRSIATPYNRIASLFRMIGKDKVFEAADAMVRENN